MEVVFVGFDWFIIVVVDIVMLWLNDELFVEVFFDVLIKVGFVLNEILFLIVKVCCFFGYVFCYFWWD